MDLKYTSSMHGCMYKETDSTSACWYRNQTPCSRRPFMSGIGTAITDQCRNRDVPLGNMGK